MSLYQNSLSELYVRIGMIALKFFVFKYRFKLTHPTYPVLVVNGDLNKLFKYLETVVNGDL